MWKSPGHKVFLPRTTQAAIWQINDLELADYVSHIHSFAPIMAPLDNISTKVKITVEKYGPDVAVSDQ